MSLSLSARRRGGALVLGLAAAAAVGAPSAAAAPGDDCADGVTVVVDLTDLGGEVEVGCAEGDPASGREALEQAGFTPTDSMPGMICAIDAMPDPCPEEFDGSFWSYWTTEGDEWVAHLEGADSIDPAPGDIEGWRYNDGATGPGVTPGELSADADDGPETAANDGPATPDDGAATPDDAGTGAAAEDGTGTATIWFVAAGVAVVAAVAALLLRRRQR